MPVIYLIVGRVRPDLPRASGDEGLYAHGGDGVSKWALHQWARSCSLVDAAIWWPVTYSMSEDDANRLITHLHAERDLLLEELQPIWDELDANARQLQNIAPSWRPSGRYGVRKNGGNSSACSRPAAASSASAIKREAKLQLTEKELRMKEAAITVKHANGMLDPLFPISSERKILHGVSYTSLEVSEDMRNDFPPVKLLLMRGRLFGQALENQASTAQDSGDASSDDGRYDEPD